MPLQKYLKNQTSVYVYISYQVISRGKILHLSRLCNVENVRKIEIFQQRITAKVVATFLYFRAFHLKTLTIISGTSSASLRVSVGLNNLILTDYKAGIYCCLDVPVPRFRNKKNLAVYAKCFLSIAVLSCLTLCAI